MRGFWRAVTGRTPSSTGVSGVEESMGEAADAQDGIYVENLKLRLPWRSFEALGALSCVISKVAPCPNRRFREINYRIRNPVIFGGLQLPELQARSDAYEDSPRLDLPVTYYFASIPLGAAWRADFERLRQRIHEHLISNGAEFLPQRVESTGGYPQWRQGGVSYALWLSHPGGDERAHPSATLKISRDPDLTPYYDVPYCNHLQLGPEVDVMLIEGRGNVVGDYRTVDDIIFTPRCFAALFSDRCQVLIWHDRASARIGIGNERLSKIRDAACVDALVLAVQNFRGSEGRVNLEVNGKCLFDLSGAAGCRARLSDLQDMLGKPVREVSYDEHY